MACGAGFEGKGPEGKEGLEGNGPAGKEGEWG